MAVTVYKKTALTGGLAGALDSVDGSGLLDGDMAFVNVSGVEYIFILDDDSAAAESSPSVISPDANAGDKRWVLQKLTPQVLLCLSGTAAAPPIADASNPDLGIYFGADKILFSVNNALIHEFTAVAYGQKIDAATFYMGSAYDLVFGRDDAASLQMGADSGTPVAQTFKGPDGSGTNIAGGKLTVAGGRSSGSGAGGAVAVATSPAGGAGAGANSLVDRVTVNSVGQVVVGTYSAPAASTTLLSVNVSGVSGAEINSWSTTDADAPNLTLRKSAHGTVGTHALVADDEALGSLVFAGSDGTAWQPAGQIKGEVDGAPGANDMPGALVFLTTPDGATTPGEALRLTSGKIALFASGLRVAGDPGGEASKITLTNASTQASGDQGLVLTQAAGGSGPNSAGFLKFYAGTAAVWVPYWTQLTS